MRPDGTAVTFTVDDGVGDGCEVSSSLLSPGTPRARVAITPAGAVWTDEQVRARQLLDAAYGARPRARYRSEATLVAEGHGSAVALEGPDAVPPPDKVGYWTDGAQRATYATLSGAGRRLVLEDLGHTVWRTNIFDTQSQYEAALGNAGTDLRGASGLYGIHYNDPRALAIGSSTRAAI